MLKVSISNKRLFLTCSVILLLLGCTVYAGFGINPDTPESHLPWWVYPILLFIVTLLIGILAVMAGVGGGVLFVPIVSSFFPFHFDFVRGAGLFVALALSLSAGPRLLKKGLANLRLALPFALTTSVGAVAGALIGFALPTRLLQSALGIAILTIVILMLFAKQHEFPKVDRPDTLSKFLGIGGVYFERSHDKHINWSVHRTIPAFFLFFGAGIAAGMFGLGVGWANVPVLNFVLGMPLKMAVSTSVFLMSITSTSAAWIYLNEGAILPIMLVPSVIGIMIGSKIGARLLTKTHPTVIRYIVLAVLALIGARALLKGLGI